MHSLPLLLPLTPLYRAAVWLREWSYRTGRIPRRRLSAPVVSVGNLVVGGAGKTPVVAGLAGQLRDLGYRVAILSRGYRRATTGVRIVSEGRGPLLGPEAIGDEPFLLARELDGVAVVVGEDRAAAGELAEERLGADVHLLDDGFQHLRLERDLDLLLLDAATPYADLRLLPAGPLREPLTAIARAGVVLLTRAHRMHDEVGLRRMIREHNPEAPIYSVQPRFPGLRSLQGQESDIADLAGRRVLALSGIGNPEQFEADLGDLGAVVAGVLRYPDHHRYGAGDVARIERAAEQARASVVVTTMKDLVRLEGLRTAVEVRALRMEAVVRDAPELFRRLTSVLGPSARARH